jgi:hypothetical protein
MGNETKDRFREWYWALVDGGWLALPAIQKDVLLVYGRHADSNGIAFPGSASIARKLGHRTGQHVRAARAPLIKLGLLVPHGQRGRTKVFSLPIPGPCPASINAEIRHVPYPDMSGIGTHQNVSDGGTRPSPGRSSVLERDAEVSKEESIPVASATGHAVDVSDDAKTIDSIMSEWAFRSTSRSRNGQRLYDREGKRGIRNAIDLLRRIMPATPSGERWDDWLRRRTAWFNAIGRSYEGTGMMKRVIRVFPRPGTWFGSWRYLHDEAFWRTYFKHYEFLDSLKTIDICQWATDMRSDPSKFSLYDMRSGAN